MSRRVVICGRLVDEEGAVTAPSAEAILRQRLYGNERFCLLDY